MSHLKHLHSSLSADQLVEQSLLVHVDYAELQRVEDDFERVRQVQNKEQAREEKEASIRAQIKDFTDEGENATDPETEAQTREDDDQLEDEDESAEQQRA